MSPLAVTMAISIVVVLMPLAGFDLLDGLLFQTLA